MRSLIAAAGALALTCAGLVATATGVSAAPRWAPAASAKIHPGVQMYTAGSQCTANFVFTDARANVYVGYAAHCAGLGEATDTSGCGQRSVRLGTAVTFREGGSPVSPGTRVGGGRLVYSSWITMNRLRTKNANRCDYNDFALVRVDTRDKRKVNPSVPFWGGPTGIDTNGTVAGDRVYSYGNSGLRFGVEELAPKTGTSLGDDPADGGWSHPVYTLTPGVPGDSGSAYLNSAGRAVGTLSTIGLAPLPASNNLGDLARELAFAQRYSGIRGLRLVRGTQPFRAVL